MCGPCLALQFDEKVLQVQNDSGAEWCDVAEQSVSSANAQKLL